MTRASSIPPCFQKRRARAEGMTSERAMDALLVANAYLFHNRRWRTVTFWRHVRWTASSGTVDDVGPDVTLETLHDDLAVGFADLKGEMRAGFADLKGEMRAGFGDLKATLVAGFVSLPRRESSEEMVRLLREGNRLQDERFTQLDLRIREQHLESQQVLHAILEGQRVLVDGLRGLSTDIKALIARLDALIQGRGNGEPAA